MVGDPMGDTGKRSKRAERTDRIATREEMISKKERRCKQGSKGASNACGREEKTKGSVRHDSKKPRMSDVQ